MTRDQRSLFHTVYTTFDSTIHICSLSTGLPLSESAYNLPFPATAKKILIRLASLSLQNSPENSNLTAMKYIIIIGDGMADEPVASLGEKTPLQVAEIPNIDWITKQGRSGMLTTVPNSMDPGSAVANMGVLGYDVEKVFEGRGSLEAASIGVDLHPGEMALRCNFINLENSIITSHAAGHITTEESAGLIHFINERIGEERTRFYPGVSYRNLAVIKGGNKSLRLIPPHNILGDDFREFLPEPLDDSAQETAELLTQLTIKSQEILADHPINTKRITRGLLPANSIWLWSAGYRPEMPTLKDLYGIERAAVITAVDLIKGIGIYAGMNSITVPGATGLYDTNYRGKAEAAINALENNDLIYLHIEASDEAGHEGDVPLKIRTIEDIDRHVVKYILENRNRWKDELSIAVLPDHPTPCALKTHTRDPVPFSIYTPGATPDSVDCYNEFSVRNGAFGFLKGPEFMKTLLGQ